MTRIMLYLLQENALIVVKQTYMSIHKRLLGISCENFRNREGSQSLKIST